MRNLTHAEAKSRSESVLSGIEYCFYINLKKGADYHGNVHITFALKKVEDIFIDFSGEKIINFKVNDSPLIANETAIQEKWQKGKLRLDSQSLMEGVNTVQIQFDNRYDTDGNGLHTFTDLDQKQYIYTQSEPYFFNKVVPVFDQPDLKAYASFYVMHPRDWLVISNTDPQVQFTDLNSSFMQGDSFLKQIRQARSGDFSGDSQMLSIFGRTKRISSYLFSLVAGPYERVDLEKSKRFRDIPMSMYFRKSLSEFALPLSEKVFEVSVKGIQFYEEFFGHAYPFGKWDSAFCPEFTVGAMEYPGVVTYNDNYIFREKNPNRSRLSYLCTVILHEMAHMWYGNYVTMRWWDGLWLNESFAEFMNYKSFEVVQKSLSFPTDNAWSMMNEGKNWGYKEDANSNTHPIACDVVDTQMADAIFDGITYSKGAAVIQQLYYLIGEDLFRKNIKNYFEEFKWKNTELEDLLRHLKAGSEQLDMQSWNYQWIETAGTNTVQVKWDPSQKGAQTITLSQGARLEKHSTLRRHKLDLAFFKEDGTIGLIKTVSLLDQEQTEVEVDNQDYRAVLPNANDWTFICIELDPHSRDFFIDNLRQLDELSMLLVVRSLFADVKRARIKGDVFIDLIRPNLQHQLDNPTLMNELSSFILSAIGFIPYALRDAQKDRLFETVWDLAQKTDNKMVLNEIRTILLGSAASAQNVSLLQEVNQGVHELGEKIKFTERDSARINLWVITTPDVDAKLKAEAQAKFEEEAASKENFKKYKLTVDTFKMDLEQKKAFWQSEVLNPKRTKSYVELIYSLHGICARSTAESERRFFAEDYFAKMGGVFQKEDKQIVETFIDYALPYWEDQEWVLAGYEQVLQDTREYVSEFAKNELLTKIDDIKIKLKAFALYK